jgi:hypothetical protein
LLEAAEIDGRPVVSPVKAPGRMRVPSAEELELLLGFVVYKGGKVACDPAEGAIKSIWPMVAAAEAGAR